MSEAKQNITCPLGSECDVHKLNKVSGEIERYTCRWWIKRDSQHPETKEITTIKDCAMSWLPLMLHENAKQQVNTTAALVAGKAYEKFYEECQAKILKGTSDKIDTLIRQRFAAAFGGSDER